MKRGLFVCMFLLVSAVTWTAFAQDPLPAPPPPTTVLDDLLTAVKSKSYLPLFGIALLYIRKLLSPDSKFPITIPARWLGVVSAFVGLVYGFVASLQAGSSIATALLACTVLAATSGFFDGLLTAIFNHDDAPKWAKALVLLVDNIVGGKVIATATETQTQTTKTEVIVKTAEPETDPDQTQPPA
jgi:hypothetical protein